MRIYLNRDWDFYFDSEKSRKEVVNIPHTVKVTPFNSFYEDEYQTVCRYEKKVEIPKEAKGKRLILHIDGAAHRATVFVNKVELYTHKCGYTSFDVDITEAVAGSTKPVVMILLDTRESLNQPPFGNVIDYMTYGGIYREIWLDVKEQVYIKSTYHHYIEEDASSEASEDETAKPVEKTLASRIVLGGCIPEDLKSVNITQNIKDEDGKNVASISVDADIVDGIEGKEVNIKSQLGHITKWDVTNPVMYNVETTIETSGFSDTFETNMGFRTAVWKTDGFYLNGKKLRLRGINRHQSYAYVGYAMPGNIQREDALILKNELGMNAVRTSHYPQSREFIEECDRLGLLVFTEIPGWQFIGDDEWKEQAVKNTMDMVISYRNHPSIVLWGVRINESMDDDDLYEKTNDIARKLAPGIFTGGVRFIQKSSLLEDVYTYNDFIYNGKTKGACAKREVTSDTDKAYLVSEYNGHMFPTKPYDDEIHRVEHALRHATVLNAIYGHDDIAGSFGWCMFDYNTHKDFGSGDRICYHGIMDMFRNPKLAAAVYKSQSDDEPVLEVASDMNIGEYPGSDFRQVYVFTNLDSIKLYKNGNFIKEFFPDDKEYKNLPHPPVIVDDFIGELLISQEGFSESLSERMKKVLFAIREHGMKSLPLGAMLSMARMMVFDHMTIKKGYDLFSKYVGGWGDKVKIYEFVGMKDGQEVMRVRRSPSEKIHLDVKRAGDTLIEENGYDASSVRIRVLNQNGSVETYINEEVYLEASGSIEIIGPSTTVLRGGMGGTYVRSNGAGKGTLIIRFRDEEVKLVYNVMAV